jgi:hypothetical protein
MTASGIDVDLERPCTTGNAEDSKEESCSFTRRPSTMLGTTLSLPKGSTKLGVP